MMNVLLLGYIALLALFVWLGLIPFNRFWKVSPVIVAVVLVVGLFIPMGWGAPSGAAIVARNSVQVVPSVAGEVTDVPVAANTPLKQGDVLFRIDPTTYQAQVDAVEAQLKLAELRLNQYTFAVSRVMGKYLGRNTGFVLWIVPNEAIYTQTLKHLKDRQHPYRQALDRAAAGRVRIMEKTDRLDSRDVETNLCVMLLMLQSANRETQDSLKMFQDRGDVHGFFPPEGEQQLHEAALAKTPNLDAYADMFPMVKDSLGNALRIIRPMVVLDEGHRAISDLAFRTLYGFNPCFVLELTATPLDVQPRGGKSPRDARYANVLVEITGRDLDREGMIKMPLNLDPRQGTDWKSTLNAALVRLNVLDRDARKLKANTGRYIRPIMLIQVERTGADQRSSKHIHAEDVKDWLLTAGLDSAEIAVKTAEQNDLSQPENQDLLAPTNRIRAIITKQALQEGWDCPFAYVLCSLAASSNLNAMTQLIGRILRQPGALKTGVGALDECHVITHHAKTADVVDAIKYGLEKDGLGDLVLQVSQDDAKKAGKGSRKIKRRSNFSSHQIYLPKVLVVDDADARDLDYETDVLSAIDWRGFDPNYIAAWTLELVKNTGETVDMMLILMSEWEAKLPHYLKP